MSITLEWYDIALRLALSAIAGALVGVNRGEHGRPAGLRTTLLVCLAASITMIQTNILLGTVGRPPNSFVMLDVMRLPLGVLSGMGFIGGGAILKRDNIVLGVTTAATLWFVTILGLCFGGGQHVLGLVSLALGLVTLWGLKWLELQIPQDRHGTLILTSGPDGPSTDEIREKLVASGFRILSLGITYDASVKSRELCCELRWRALPIEVRPPHVLDQLAESHGVSRLRWSPQGLPAGLG